MNKKNQTLRSTILCLGKLEVIQRVESPQYVVTFVPNTWALDRGINSARFTYYDRADALTCGESIALDYRCQYNEMVHDEEAA